MPTHRPQLDELALSQALDSWQAFFTGCRCASSSPFHKLSRVLDSAHPSDGPVRMRARALIARRIAAIVGQPASTIKKDVKIWRERAADTLGRALRATPDHWIHFLAVAFARSAACSSLLASTAKDAKARRRDLSEDALHPNVWLHDSPAFNDLVARCLADALDAPSPERQEALLLGLGSVRGSCDPAISLGESLARNFAARFGTRGFGLPPSVRSWRHEQLFGSGELSWLFDACGCMAPADAFWTRVRDRASRDAVSMAHSHAEAGRVRQCALSLAEFSGGSPEQGLLMAGLCRAPCPPGLAMATLLACQSLPCCADVARAARPAYERAAPNRQTLSMMAELRSAELRIELQAELPTAARGPGARL